jgi:hypothetical protein
MIELNNKRSSFPNFAWPTIIQSNSDSSNSDTDRNIIKSGKSLTEIFNPTLISGRTAIGQQRKRPFEAENRKTFDRGQHECSRMTELHGFVENRDIEE